MQGIGENISVAGTWDDHTRLLQWLLFQVFRDEYGWNVDHKITKTCGIDPACQAVLVEASKRLDAGQSCVFVDIVDQIHPAARSFCEGLLPNPDTATNTDYEQSHEQILAYLLNNSHWAVSQDRVLGVHVESSCPSRTVRL